MYTWLNIDLDQRWVYMFFYAEFLFLFFSLTSVGAYFMLKYKANRLVLWASVLMMCGGLVGLQVVLEKGWLPYVVEQQMSSIIIIPSLLLTSLLNLAVNTIPYYVIAVFYFLYNGVVQQQRWLFLSLSLPIWVTLIFQTDLLENRVNTGFVALWGLVYLVVTVYLAVRFIVREQDDKQRLIHTSIALIFLIPVAILNMYHFSVAPFSDQLLSMIPYVSIAGLLAVAFLYFCDAFLGVTRKSMHTVHVGTGLIHHSLKNAIGKIKLNALNIRKNVQNGDYAQIDTHVDNLLKTHEAMIATMSTISHVVSSKIEPRKEYANLADILDEVLEPLGAYPDIQVVKHYAPITLFIDRMLVMECLQNICNNAVEAMKERGTLQVGLEVGRNKAKVIIRDTGQGMNSLQLQNIFEPFYSTKHRSGKHFGLGMYQVKKVMGAHRGKAEVKSAPNAGTTVMLTFQYKKGSENNE